MKGVASGKEEHKMGLHGSSTTPLVLQDVPVPANGLLGEVGKGPQGRAQHAQLRPVQAGGDVHRRRQGGGRRGGAYAVSRKQFGQPIANFGAIQHKLGEMTARVYGSDSALYRTCGLLDAGLDTTHDLPGTLEEFAIEASILKVAASRCSTTCSTRTCRSTAATAS
jgi:alkylation response protein AidB-like acyl-CoA dehydrogenase